jgi:hypothetical protein
MRLKLFALIAALVVAGGCASAGSAKHTAAVTVNTVEAALALADDTERALECGVATSIEGHCLNPEQAHAAKEKLRIGFRSITEARNLYLLLPPCPTSKPGEAAVPCPPPNLSQITALVLEGADIVREILAGFPDTKAKSDFAATPQVRAIVSAKGVK